MLCHEKILGLVQQASLWEPEFVLFWTLETEVYTYTLPIIMDFQILEILLVFD